MPQSQRDHGVAGRTHWLLDEELIPRRGVRTPQRQLPVLLRHEDLPELAPLPAAHRVPEPTRNSRLLAAGLLAALAVYLLLRGTGLGEALQGVLSQSRDDGNTPVSAMFLAAPEAPPGAGEAAALRALLAAVPKPDLSRAASLVLADWRPAEPARRESNGATDEPVAPLQPPPAPLPAPDPSSLVPTLPQASELLEGLKRATGLEPATLSLEG